MQARDPGFGKTRLVRKGIVAQSTVRLAAGASVVAASLLIVGPNPAHAVADKHGSHSNNDRKNGSDSQGGNAKRPVSNWVNDTLDLFGLTDDANGQTPDIEPPPMNLGGDSAELFVVQSADAPAALR